MQPLAIQPGEAYVGQPYAAHVCPIQQSAPTASRSLKRSVWAAMGAMAVVGMVLLANPAAIQGAKYTQASTVNTRRSLSDDPFHVEQVSLDNWMCRADVDIPGQGNFPACFNVDSSSDPSVVWHDTTMDKTYFWGKASIPVLGIIEAKLSAPNCEPQCGDPKHFPISSQSSVQCYYIPEAKLSWTQARDYCANGGATLAVPDYRDDVRELHDLYYNSEVRGEGMWVGLHDRNVEGEFEWVNGAGNDPLSSSYTWIDSTSTEDKDCVEQNQGDSGYGWQFTGWQFAQCDEKKRFACQKEGGRRHTHCDLVEQVRYLATL